MRPYAWIFIFACMGLASSNNLMAQTATGDTLCFHRLFAAAQSWEARDSFIRAISHYDAARACPDVTRRQDSIARSEANHAREKWEQQLRDQIQIAVRAQEAAEDSAQSAIRARKFADAERRRAVEAQKRAVRNARASEAGRLALEADEETDVLLSSGSQDQDRKEDALMAGYWAMRWAGDTLQTEVTRSFGNAVFLTSRQDYTGTGAMGVDFGPDGYRYLKTFYSGVGVYSDNDLQYRLPSKGYTRDVYFDEGRAKVVTTGKNAINTWKYRSSDKYAEPVEVSGGRAMTSAYSPESGLYVAGGRDGTIRVWNDPSHVRLLEGHTGPITHLSFMDHEMDGVQIVSVSKDKTVRIWRSSGSSTGIPPLENYIVDIITTPDQKVLITSKSEVIIWDVTDPNFERAVYLEHDALVSDLILTVDGRSIISITKDGKAHKWSFNGTKESELSLFGTGAMGLVRLSDNRCAAWSASGNIAFFDDEVNAMHLPLNVQNNLRDVIGSPSGEYFLTIGNDRSIALWDDQGIEWMSPPRFDSEVWNAGFSPDGKYLWASTKIGDQERAWICIMPELMYNEMVQEDLRPSQDQVERFRMIREIPETED